MVLNQGVKRKLLSRLSVTLGGQKTFGVCVWGGGGGRGKGKRRGGVGIRWVVSLPPQIFPVHAPQNVALFICVFHSYEFPPKLSDLKEKKAAAQSLLNVPSVVLAEAFD